MARKMWILLVLLALLLAPAYAADQYKPYMHSPAVPDRPAVRLFGQYNTLLFPGAATYNYPIEVPPGIHGLQPRIELYYNSQSAQQRPGILGAGWSMNHNYVMRDINATPDNVSDDKFLLSFENALYELVFNAEDQQWHTEVEYHFKILKATGGANSNGEYWLLTTKDGKTYRFGYNQDSELLSNTGRGYVLRWSLDQVTDTFQNTISYSYLEDPRAEDAGTSYLSQIAYNSDKRRIVTFSYEASPRPDLRKGYEQGNVHSESRRLTSITVYAEGLLLRRYQFTYAGPASAVSTLSSIARYGADNRSLLHTIAFSYTLPVKSYTNTSAWQLPVGLTDTTGVDFGVRFVDLNNDGFVDLIQGRQSTNELKAWLNNRYDGWVASQGFAPPAYIVTTAGGDAGVRFADINNDGLPDLLKAFGGSSQVYFNNGTAWALNASWTIPVSFADANGLDQGVQLNDINNDGRIDILLARAGTTFKTYLNNGSAWVDKSATWVIPVALSDTKDTGARVIDINGDGLPDILQAANGDAVRKAWLNNGSGWSEYSTTWVAPVEFTSTTYDDTGVRFLDVNGDGLTDLVQNFVNGTTILNKSWMNTGSGWQLDLSWQLPDAFVTSGSNMGRRLADLNGDNTPDLIISDKAGNKKTWIASTTYPFLLANITSEYGGTTTISYTTSTQYNNTDTDGVSDIGFNIFVVKSIRKDNGLPPPFNVTGEYNYSYHAGKYQYEKREFRGFGMTTEQQPTALLTHHFYQDSPRRGKEYATATYSLDGAPYAKRVTDYNYTLRHGIYNLSVRSTTEYQYDGTTLPRITNTSYVYDWFGNPQLVVEHGDVAVGGDERTTSYVYAYNKQDWIMNRPARISIVDAHGQKTKEVTNFYDGLGFTGIGSRGALSRTESWNNQGNNSLTTYEYDRFGNVIKETNSAGATTHYNYDTTHTYLANTINALGHITYYSYDLGTGNLNHITKNDITTFFVYDTHGRIVAEVRPYDDLTMPTKKYYYRLNGSAPSSVQVSLRTAAEQTQDVTYYYDGFANLVQLKSATDEGDAIKTLYYDGAGQVRAEDNPFLAPAGQALVMPPPEQPQTAYVYDPAGRVVLVRNPDGTNKTTHFSKSNITDYDENGHRHAYHLDAYGRITAVVEYNVDPRISGSEERYTTTYAYDNNDNLVQIVDHAGNRFNFSYDSLGRKTRMEDPDMGVWTYTYDARGNLVQQVDARGEAINLSYDLLNRVVSKRAADTTYTFVYDQQYLGTLTQLSMNNVTFSYTYDDRLRVVQQRQTIDGLSFTSSYWYDAQDRLVAEQGLSKVDYLYNKQGQIKAIPGYVTDARFDAFGGLLNRTYANGLVATYEYDNQTHRLRTISIPNVQNLTYTYDGVGNIKSINDVTAGTVHVLTYDGLDRLIEATVGTDRYAYSYDPLGNVMNIVKNNETKRFVYTGRAHGPSAIIEGGAGADVYHVAELEARSKNRTFEFYLINDQLNSTSGVNVTVAFGDGNTYAAHNLTVDDATVFLIEHNYSLGGNYPVNITSATAQSNDYEIKQSRFGIHASGLRILDSNLSERTFEFAFGSDVQEPLQNVSWNCTGINSTIPITLTGSLLDYLRVNYSTSGKKNFTCTAQGPDGNDTQTVTFSIDGLEITSFDTLATNISHRVVAFHAKNNYYPAIANVSIAAEDAAFGNLTALQSGEQLMIFAEINNTVGDAKGIAVTLAGPEEVVHYTHNYDVKGVSIDEFARVDTGENTKVFLYDVRNTWRAGDVTWTLSDPALFGQSFLENNQTMTVIVESAYQGPRLPTFNATSATYSATVTDRFTAKPVAIAGLQTLRGGPGAITELVLQSASGAQNVTWRFIGGQTQANGSALVDSPVTVIIEGEYGPGVTPVVATVGSAQYNDTQGTVVIA